MKLIIALLMLSSTVFAMEGYETLASSVIPKVVDIRVKGVITVPERPVIELGKSTNTVIVERSTKTVVFGGAGSLISSDGFILTCFHLFDEPMGNMEITVRTSDGKRYTAFLIGSNPDADLALLKVFPLTKLPYFKLGKPVRRGQPVVSFGAPLGISQTATAGYVSNPKAKHPLGEDTYTMHTASINPGNSGGPLVNMRGELVGVNVATFTSNMFATAEGMHLAVLMEEIQKFLGDK